MSTIYKIFKPLLLLLVCLPMLFACSSWLQPKHITIEYDEEVKLHNGEMIWVHITRHYLEGGKEISEMFRGSGKNVIPNHVEISWDTGFEGVGRKSVYFKRQIWTIERLDNQWYVYGATDRGTTGSYNNSISCNDVGTLYFRGDACLVRVNSSGDFLKSPNDEIFKLDKVNVLYSYGLAEVENLNKKKLTWQNKLDMQIGKPKDKQTINRKLFS